VLDPEGHHATICDCGGGLGRRHDAARDLIAKSIAKDLGLGVHMEQHMPAFDTVDAHGRIHYGRMDIVVTTPAAQHLVDVTIVSAWSGCAATESGPAARDGTAALRAEDNKRLKYRGVGVIPLVIEHGGRWGPTGLAWLRALYKDESESFQELVHNVAILVQGHISSMVVASSSGIEPSLTQ